MRAFVIYATLNTLLDIYYKKHTITVYKPPKGVLNYKNMAITSFLKGLRAEWAHIVWPSEQVVAWYTVIVIIVAFLVAYYLGLLDLAFSKLLAVIIS